MATVEIELRKYVKANGTQPLVLRITSGKKVMRKNTGLYVKAAHWDAKKRKVNNRNSEAARLNAALEAMVEEAEASKADSIKRKQAVVPAKVMESVFKTNDFYELAQARMDKFTAQDKHFSAANYQAMISRLKQFAPVLSVQDIDSDFIERYRDFLKTPRVPGGQGARHNTIVSHLNRIAAVLRSSNLKIDDPFNEVTKGSYRRAKSPDLDIEDIEKIKRYTPGGKWESVAKDTFLFSFYAAGMSSKDILLLQWEDIRKGRIEFGRRKVENTSGVQLSIPLNDITETILNKYPKGAQTVFNLVSLGDNSKAADHERSSVQAMIRAGLRVISLNSGVGKPIKFKDARTLFARIANEASGRNVYGIQQAMGHTKIATTEIYLGNDSRAVDELLAQVYK